MTTEEVIDELGNIMAVYCDECYESDCEECRQLEAINIASKAVMNGEEAGN